MKYIIVEHCYFWSFLNWMLSVYFLKRYIWIEMFSRWGRLGLCGLVWAGLSFFFFYFFFFKCFQLYCAVWGWGPLPPGGQHHSMSHVGRDRQNSSPVWKPNCRKLIWLGTEIDPLAVSALLEWNSNNVSVLSAVSPASAPDQGHSDPGYTETHSQLHAIVFPNWPWYVFLFLSLCCYQRVFVNLSEKAIKQRQPTTMITIITVNNQAKQDGVTVNIEIGGGTLFALLRHFPVTPDFFFSFLSLPFSISLDAQQAECSICSTARCAAWLWH